MGRQIDIDKITNDEFSPFANDGFSKINGLVYPSDFNVKIFFNKTLISDNNLIGFSLSEYVSSPGNYWIEFQPNQIGFWEIEIYCPQAKQYWYETYDVVYGRDPGDSANRIMDIRGSVVWNSQRDELVMIAWLINNGELVTAVGNCFWEFYDSEGNLLFSVNQNTPFSNGIYRAKKSGPGFQSEENYYYLARIHDGIKMRTSALGIITII